MTASLHILYAEIEAASPTHYASVSARLECLFKWHALHLWESDKAMHMILLQLADDLRRLGVETALDAGERTRLDGAWWDLMNFCPEGGVSDLFPLE